MLTTQGIQWIRHGYLWGSRDANLPPNILPGLVASARVLFADLNVFFPWLRKGRRFYPEMAHKFTGRRWSAFRIFLLLLTCPIYLLVVRSNLLSPSSPSSLLSLYFPHRVLGSSLFFPPVPVRSSFCTLLIHSSGAHVLLQLSCVAPAANCALASVRFDEASSQPLREVTFASRSHNFRSGLFLAHNSSSAYSQYVTLDILC